MRMLLLTAAAAAALASALMGAQAQEGDRSEQAPAAGAIQPRAVKTESFRAPAPSGQASTGASTDSRATESAAADRPNVRQPSTPRRMVRVQRQRVAERPRPRPAQERALRTRKPTTTGQATGSAQERALRTRRPTTTGQATGRVSSEVRPSRSRPLYAQAVYVAPRYVEPRAAGTGVRIALTEPQVARLNAAFTDYIVRMNVWSRPPWEFPATVGATVPAWVQVYGVPVEIVALYPEFAGDEFVVVGDDIVVMEPASRRIVAMISRTSNAIVAVLDEPPSTTGSSTTGLAPLPEARVRLTRAQIAIIRTVARDPACRYERPADFFIGSLMPAAAPVCAFPERVIAAVPEIGDFRYITRRNAVVVVDPGNDRVVTVLR
jgi:hypothetical protein